MKRYDPRAQVTNESLEHVTDRIVELIEEFRGEVNQRFDELERRVDRQPSRMEFDRLKQRVDELEQLVRGSATSQ